jgi:LuxR family maltose regulon positive regulatory protein
VSGISSLKVLLWVRLGKLDEAEEYLRKRGIRAESKIRYSFQREYISLAALLIKKGEYKSAGVLLDNISAWAEATKQYRTIICVQALYSLLFAAQKETQKALRSLAHAMELAEPEGYLLTILELGEGIAPLLYKAFQKGIQPEYASRLLEGLKETLTNPLARPQVQKGQPNIYTPLRTREIEVLKLATDGHTNKEIAQELHISLRTVKFHMTNIFTKLGVANRMQAVSKAKILGIVQ